MSKEIDILIAWVAWAKTQPHGEIDSEMIKAVEDLYSQVGTFRAERDLLKELLAVNKQFLEVQYERNEALRAELEKYK